MVAPRAIVTGSSSGIGAAVAQRLLVGGWQVRGLDRAAPSLVHERFHPLEIDLADGERAIEAVADLLAGGSLQALPAATGTPMLGDPARGASAPHLPPIGRLIRPDEVAALAAFLLSPEAATITGQDIALCGGATLPR